MQLSPTSKAGSGNRLLRLYGYYSLFLALLIIVVDSIDKQDRLLGERAPQLFLILSSVYVISAATFVAIANRRPDSQATTSYMFIETALLTGMMYASGGLAAGFSSLLLIPVIMANLLAPGVLGYGVAAWLSLAVFYTQHILHGEFGLSDTANTGVYGAITFAIATITQLLSRRIRTAIDLAQDQAYNARRLQRLSQQALMTLPDGIIACTRYQQILFFNQQAADWFPLRAGEKLPPALEHIFRSEKLSGAQPLTVSRISIPDTDGDFLLVIEDDTRVAAEAQQIKLASLGRLTASIAHEIRNPLSALQQASQLLSETPGLSPENQRLTRMIEDNSQRINRTIADILQLSRGRQARCEPLELAAFLDHFKRQFLELHPQNDFDLVIHSEDSPQVRFDADHLVQVLNNLCNNGLRYARRLHTDKPQLTLTVMRGDHSHTILDVSDNGGGVCPEQQERLFEPFHTTEPEGTGLGLYLCRELCQANEADISYTGHPGGALFRIRMKDAE
jgi:two-component system sensor histidine kinase PilS (NtrC family)